MKVELYVLPNTIEEVIEDITGWSFHGELKVLEVWDDMDNVFLRNIERYAKINIIYDEIEESDYPHEIDVREDNKVVLNFPSSKV